METTPKIEKRNRIIYWIATIWLCLGLASSGIVQTLRIEEEVQSIVHLGYPVYFLTIMGIWKLLAVIALLLPRFPLLKEWAYAGVVFNMTGAALSHVIMGSVATEVLPPLLILALTVTSWYFRPADRRLVAVL